MTDRSVTPSSTTFNGSDDMSKSIGAGQSMKNYVLVNLQQPSTGIPSVITTAAPDFVSHLMTSQNNANHFITAIEPMMAQDVTNIMSYGSAWKNFGPYFIQLGNQGKWDEVESGLKMIQKNMTTYKNHAKTTASELTSFTGIVAKDAGAFSNDYTKISSKQSGVPASIDGLNKLIDAENKAITYAAIEISAGAVGTIGGIALCVAGGIGEIFTGGASTPMVVAGGVLIAGGITAVTVGSIQIDKASHAIASAQARISELNAEMSQLKSYSNVSQQLQLATQSATHSVGTLATSWDYLFEDMNALIGDVRAARQSEKLPWFEPAINTTVDAWSQLNTIAANAQKQVSQMEVTNVDMKSGYKSLLNALPKADAAAIRASEAHEVSMRHEDAA